MPELLLEILSEEIPARMQARAADDLKRLVMEGLKEAGLEFTGARAFATPRRLALVVDGLPERQPDVSEERRGPQVGAPERAIEGFLGSVGLALDQCEKREVKGKEFWFAVVEKKGGPVSEVLAEILPRMLPALPWPKSMRWGKGETRWVRPIHNLLGIFSGGGLASGAFGLPFRMTTLGHRFMEPEPITVTGFADYNAKLRKAKVILDAGERAEIIRSESEKIAGKEDLKLRDDPGLLNEVAGLVEWPVVLMGAIDEKFMDLPPEVLTQAMRAHQKYFALTDEAGRLAPRFIVVANTETADGGKAVVAGNERVLRARLSDARFFWDTDRKEKLEARVARLGGVVFHAKLGTLAEKVDRMESLAAELAESIPGAEKNAVTRAAHVAKADLVTGMVGEFPELQGVMGRYYALEDGETAEVADAIADHYAPQGPHDRCPSAPVSVAVALADKIDSLVGFFAIDEKPTGSRDPFALRRAALGVIRIVTENGLRLPLTQTFDAAERGYGDSRKCFEGALDPGDLLAFFADRLKVQMREQGVRHDLIEAVFATPKPEGGTEDDLVRLLARVAALTGFLATDDGANLLTAYKRAANIVRIEERKDKTSYEGEADPKLLVEDEEKALQGALEGARASLDAALANEDFAAAMAELAKLRGPVDAFFDRVTVNCGDEKLRANRLRLLGRIRAALNLVADFSRIEG